MRILLVTTATLFLFTSFANRLNAQGFFDDFSNLSATDGDPVTWVAGVCEDCSRDASSGNYVLTPNAAGDFMTSLVERTYSDLSIQTRVRLLGDDDSFSLLGVLARASDDGAYYAGISWQFDTIGIYSTAAEDPLATVSIGDGIQLEDEDLNLKFELFGSTLSLTAWLNDDPQPIEPQLTVVDDAFSAGSIGLYYDTTPFRQPPAAFRFVKVVPEPSAATLIIAGCVGLLTRRRRKT